MNQSLDQYVYNTAQKCLMKAVTELEIMAGLA
jgi:hypothetical protein